MLDQSIGEPLFNPTIYTVSVLRSANLASNTIEAVLRAVMVFYIFLDLRKINLNQRLLEGKLITLGEIEDLVRLCRHPLIKIYEMQAEVKLGATAKVRAITSEKYRMKLPSAENSRDVTSAANRVGYIRDYLQWEVDNRLLKNGLEEGYRVVLASSSARAIGGLSARIPSKKNRNVLSAREGIGRENIDKLLAAIDPNSPDNPWRGQFTRKRNQLIIHWLYELGLRQGELLGLEVSEINFRENTVMIARKADSKKDPRRKQPLTKTLDRILPISNRLAQMSRDYLLHIRNGKKRGLPHGFFIVATGGGSPLTTIGLNKMFENLRKKLSFLPDDFSPHVLRHDANDAFSADMDRRQIPPEQEEAWRSEIMGWKKGSQTAKNYTKRHDREKAAEASLSVQNEIGKSLKNEK